VNNRALVSGVVVALVALGLSLGGAALAASIGGARSVGRAQTLFVGSRSIYAFALGARRITWVTRTHRRGRYPGCEMYVRALRTGVTVRAPLPRAGCGVKPPMNFVAQAPVLAAGVAAWVKGSSCGNTECFWKIATIAGGEAKARVVDTVDIGCPPPACGLRHGLGKGASGTGPPYPRPALAGHGNLLVYSSGGPTVDKVFRIVGKHHGLFAVPPGGGIESLAVGNGAVEVDSSVLDVGDGCGCVDSPVWSPDGSQIAYLDGHFSNQQFDPTPPDASLAVMNANGSGRHDLTTPATLNDESFSWSPDGKQIAYVSPSESGDTITVVNADGSGSLPLGPGYDPAWSPDGSKISFVSAGCGGKTAAISVMNADGTNPHQLASFALGPTCVDPGGMAWSPDGTRIAFSLNGVLEVMNADGTNAHELGNDTVGNEPAWSPDSSQIVFHENSGLWQIGADGSNLHQLTSGPDEHPSWSSDGKTIVFGSDRDDPYVGEAAPELYLVDPNGGDLRPLSFTTPTAFEEQDTFYAANGKPLPSLSGVPTLAGRVAAVGSTSSGDTHEITLFDATTGEQLAVVEVGTSRQTFALAGAYRHWVVFRIGRTISALNTQSHRIIHLTQAAARPIDLAVSGRRVAWAENVNDHGRIRTVELP
jgi:TolB protein